MGVFGALHAPKHTRKIRKVNIIFGHFNDFYFFILHFIKFLFEFYFLQFAFLMGKLIPLRSGIKALARSSWRARSLRWAGACLDFA